MWFIICFEEILIIKQIETKKKTFQQERFPYKNLRMRHHKIEFSL